MTDTDIPTEPLYNKAISELIHGDIVNTRGVHVVENTASDSQKMTTVRLSDGSSITLPTENGELPYYGSVIQRATKG